MQRHQPRRRHFTSAGGWAPNAVIVKVGAGGNVYLDTLAATHLIVDVNGWMTT